MAIEQKGIMHEKHINKLFRNIQVYTKKKVNQITKCDDWGWVNGKKIFLTDLSFI